MRRRGLPLFGLLIATALATAGLSLLQASGPGPGSTEEAAASAEPSPYPPLRDPLSAPHVPIAPPAKPVLTDGWRILVPRLAVDLPLAEGDLARDLQRQATPVGAAFHLPWSALPGQVGNSYLYSHARRGMFLPLWNIRLGDTVEVVRPDGERLRYRVAKIVARVPADDLSYLQPTEDERLTLQTSTGTRAADPRFVVVALPEAP